MSFDTILRSPGLSFLGINIFLSLDLRSFAACESVCRTWARFFEEYELWRLRTELEVKRPPNSYLAHVFRKELSSSSVVNEEDDRRSCSRFYRRLCRKLTFGYKSRAWFGSEKPNEFSFRNSKIVRDLKIIDESRLLFASEGSILIADRVPLKKNLLNVTSEFRAHQREVTCIDLDRGILVSGSRDRKLMFWDIGRCKDPLIARVDEAHERLITRVRIRGTVSVSSSRDRTVKIWNLESDSGVQLLQVLTGHRHSVWTVDMNDEILATGSADSSIEVWKKTKKNKKWENFHFFKGHVASVRNLMLVQRDPDILISGCCMGDVFLWNIPEKRLLYSFEEEYAAAPRSVFRQSVEVVAMDQTYDVIAVAYSNKVVVIYSLENLRIELPVLRTLSLDDGKRTGFIRNVTLAPDSGVIYICSVSGDCGIVAFDFWDSA